MRISLTILLCVLAAAVSAQTIVGRQLQITLNTGDGTYPTCQALLWLPDDYNSTSQTYPLIISLGGDGEHGSNINLLLNSGQLAKYIADGYNPVGVKDGVTYKYMVLSPLGPGGTWGWSTQINTFITQLKASYRVNANQIYLTGLSQGGWGVQQAFTSSTTVTNITAATIISPGDYVQAGCDKIGQSNKPVWVASRSGEAYNVAATNAYNRIVAQGGTNAVRTVAAGSNHDLWVSIYDHTQTWSDLGGKNWFDWLIQFGDADAPVPCGNVIDLNNLRGAATGKSLNSGSGIAPCDTLEFYGNNWTYLSISDLHGAPDKHIVIRPKKDSIVHMSSGIELISCSYVDIYGLNATNPTGLDSFGIKIHESGSGVGITFKGLTRTSSVRYVEVYNKAYGGWSKQESNQTGCDSTQWYPHFQDSIIVEHNYLHNLNQEGWYSGSTDPLGLAPERAVTCFDSTFTPRSAYEKNMYFRYNRVENTIRTGIQSSAQIGGEIAYNRIINCGGDNGGTQWPGIWIGGQSTNVKVHHNYIDSTLRDNITDYGSATEIYNNYGRHNGVHRNWNTDNSISTINYYNNYTKSIRTTNPYMKAQVNVHDNDFVTPYSITTSSNVWIEGNATDYETSGNIICNTGTYALQHSVPLEACSETPPAKVTRYLKIGSKYLKIKFTKQSN